MEICFFEMKESILDLDVVVMKMPKLCEHEKQICKSHKEMLLVLSVEECVGGISDPAHKQFVVFCPAQAPIIVQNNNND